MIHEGDWILVDVENDDPAWAKVCELRRYVSENEDEKESDWALISWAMPVEAKKKESEAQAAARTALLDEWDMKMDEDSEDLVISSHFQFVNIRSVLRVEDTGKDSDDSDGEEDDDTWEGVVKIPDAGEGKDLRLGEKVWRHRVTGKLKVGIFRKVLYVKF